MSASCQNRTRLLILLPTLQGGGAERVALTLLRHIDCTRFEPHLAVVDTRQADYMAELPAGIPLHDLDCRRVMRAGPAILRLVRRLRPALIMSTVSHLNLMVAMLKPFIGRSTAVVARETTLLATDRRSPAWSAAVRCFYPRLDHVVCQSHAMQQDVCTQAGIEPRRTTVIPNPLDLNRISELAKVDIEDHSVIGRRLIAVGRLSYQKGYDMLIEALSRCRDLPWHLVILGQGPMEADLRAQLERLGLDNRIELRGFVANPYPWMRRADALLLSSRYEGLPNVVLEALACGTPVVSTPDAPTREIIDGIEGCVVAEDFEAPAFESALRRWMSQPPARIAPVETQRYAVGEVTERYQDLFTALADAR